MEKPRWLGPYRITEKISTVNYMVKPLYDAHRRQEKVHINRIKICKLPNLIQEDDNDTDSE